MLKAIQDARAQLRCRAGKGGEVKGRVNTTQARLDAMESDAYALSVDSLRPKRPHREGAQMPARPLPKLTSGPDNVNYYEDPVNSK